VSEGAGAGSARIWEPEALLGEEMGLAYRRFVGWMYGAGFCLGVVEVSTPWKRDALAAWTAAKCAGVETIRLDEAGPRKQSLWRKLEQACAPEANTKVLILQRLEEAEARQYLMGELNIKRDELVRAFPVMWIVLVHRDAARELQMKAPDFCDIARTWLWEEKPPELRAMLEAIDGPDMAMVPPLHGESGEGAELLFHAVQAITKGYPDEASDLLARYDMKHPRAKQEDPNRMLLDAHLSAETGRLAEARQQLEAIRRLYEARGDRVGVAVSTHALATMVVCAQGRYAEARNLLEQAIAIWGEIGDSDRKARSMESLAHVAMAQGLIAEARELFRQSMALSGEDHDPLRRAARLRGRAFAEYHQHRYSQAQELLRESIAIDERSGNRAGMADSLYTLARIAIARDSHDEARELLRESMAIQEKIGDPGATAASLHTLALVEIMQGDHERAHALLQDSAAIHQDIGDDDGLAHDRIVLGQLEVSAGRYEQGRRLVRQGVETLEAIGSGQAEAARAILREIDALSVPPA
jgi:tetratricopeptide (TPR) repeat protein